MMLRKLKAVKDETPKKGPNFLVEKNRNAGTSVSVRYFHFVNGVNNRTHFISKLFFKCQQAVEVCYRSTYETEKVN